MSKKHVLQILGSLEELNTFPNYETHKKIATFHIGELNFGLLVYKAKECCISVLKLTVKELIYTEENLQFIRCSNVNEGPFKITFLNVFNLPFILLDVVCTNNNIWAIGQQSAADLKPYIISVLDNAVLEEDDMDIDVDDAEEFHPEAFGTTITAHPFHKWNLHLEEIFIGCNFMKDGFICCHKNLDLNAFQLELILLKDRNIKSSTMTKVPFLDFPTFSKKCQIDTCDPVVFFIHYNDPEIQLFREIFGINCSPSNNLCLIGQPDGKLLWSPCDFNHQFDPTVKPQTLFDIKQPIIGIYFVNDIKELEGCGCMLIVGILGQITVFSSKKHPSFSPVLGQHPFWIMDAHLKSSITKCAVVKDCLVCLSNGTPWIADFSVLLNSKVKSEELCLASNPSELCCIEQIDVVDKSQGLLLFLTSSGEIYLAVCKNTSNLDPDTSSLPLLMNECLQQSAIMQKLLHKKVLQSRLFAAISTFASLKFSRSTLKEFVTFSISEVNLEPRKYILVLNMKCFEKVRLDSELCHVTATVFTYFKRNSSLVTKTAPYNVDQPTLCLELTDTDLQPPFVSIFPLYVEVGLILKLPEDWKEVDCFKSVSNFLPFYLRVQTFMVHELHLFQSNVLSPALSFRCEKPKSMKIIEELAMKRPISNILQVCSKKEYQLPTNFYLCLSVSSLKEMSNNIGDRDPCEYVKSILFGDKHSDQLSEVSVLANKKSPVSIEVTENEGKIIISLTANSFSSLIGLRIAVMDILLTAHNKGEPFTSESTFVNIPASIYRKCEDISKSLLNLYGKDVESEEVTNSIIQLYQELRRDVSAKLPIF